jgi:hypothetical protein
MASVEATAHEAGSASDFSGLYVHDDDFCYPLHIGRETVLAGVAADRALLDLHMLRLDHSYAIVGPDNRVTGFAREPLRSWPVCRHCGHGDPFTPEDWPCETVRLVATRYRYLPGYREEWGPTQ